MKSSIYLNRRVFVMRYSVMWGDLCLQGVKMASIYKNEGLTLNLIRCFFKTKSCIGTFAYLYKNMPIQIY